MAPITSNTLLPPVGQQQATLTQAAAKLPVQLTYEHVLKLQQKQTGAGWGYYTPT
jgi:hypothetical protein